jgi:hypothetical protein
MGMERRRGRMGCVPETTGTRRREAARWSEEAEAEAAAAAKGRGRRRRAIVAARDLGRAKRTGREAARSILVAARIGRGRFVWLTGGAGHVSPLRWVHWEAFGFRFFGSPRIWIQIR